jgi:copper chaperone CopZ
MKKTMMVLLASLLMISVKGQFSKARLQATGLTCAMCSNAINKALLRVPFIASVDADIKNSAFNIVFREGSSIDIDVLKKAVQDAGFSVGALELTGKFNRVAIANDEHVKLGAFTFHFIDVKPETLDGEATLKILDKDFVSAKQFKKFSALTKMKCMQTGTMDGMRVYHVTI